MHMYMSSLLSSGSDICHQHLNNHLSTSHTSNSASGNCDRSAQCTILLVIVKYDSEPILSYATFQYTDTMIYQHLILHHWKV